MSLGQNFQFRGPAQFFDSRAFHAPKDLGDLTKRLTNNVDFFQANYSVIAALALMYTCYHNGYVLLTLIFLSAIGFWLFSVRKNQIVLSGRAFSEKEVLLAFALGAGTILAYVGGSFLTYSMAFAGLVILAHASLWAGHQN